MAGKRNRLALAWCVAMLALAISPSAALADHPLEPDLVTLKLHQEDLLVSADETKTLLKLSNRVGNQGAGPLEIRPGASSTNCDGDDDPENDLPGFQRVYEHEWVPGGNNSFSETPIGCMRFHPPHNHWHVMSIARYSLYDEATGSLTEGNKVGFCLLDSGGIDGGNGGFYNANGCGNSTTLPTLTGISPGFFDLYSFATPGQRINVTGLESGRYCLRSSADPDNNLFESDDSNNSVDLQIRLNPERQVVKKLSRTCELGR